MTKMPVKDISPEDLSNQEIKNNLEEFRQGCIRIVLAYDGHKSQNEVCSYLNSWINDWIWGLGVPALISTGEVDCHEKQNEYLISFLIDSTGLYYFDEPNYSDRRVKWSYRIGTKELREYKLNQIIS